MYKNPFRLAISRGSVRETSTLGSGVLQQDIVTFESLRFHIETVLNEFEIHILKRFETYNPETMWPAGAPSLVEHLLIGFFLRWF